MKKILILSALIFTPCIATATSISGLFGHTVGESLDTSKYKSTSENVIIDGKKIESDKSSGDSYIFIPTVNELGVDFDEYNLVSDHTDKKVYAIIANKTFNKNQKLCETELKKVASVMTSKFGAPAVVQDKAVIFTDSQSSYKTAGVLCSFGLLSISINDVGLNIE